MNFYLRHIRIYDTFSDSNFSNKGPKQRVNYWFARKLAGLSLIKLKKEKNLRCDEGFVYAISNPAWPGYLKIGISIDKDKRLSSYQTCDPFRLYEIERYEFVSNRKLIEKSILNEYGKDEDVLGEWIRLDKADEIFAKLRNNIPVEPSW